MGGGVNSNPVLSIIYLHLNLNSFFIMRKKKVYNSGGIEKCFSVDDWFDMLPQQTYIHPIL